jgi:hypothetical protein
MRPQNPWDKRNRNRTFSAIPFAITNLPTLLKRHADACKEVSISASLLARLVALWE